MDDYPLIAWWIFPVRYVSPFTRLGSGIGHTIFLIYKHGFVQESYWMTSPFDCHWNWTSVYAVSYFQRTPRGQIDGLRFHVEGLCRIEMGGDNFLSRGGESG